MDWRVTFYDDPVTSDYKTKVILTHIPSNTAAWDYLPPLPRHRIYSFRVKKKGILGWLGFTELKSDRARTEQIIEKDREIIIARLRAMIEAKLRTAQESEGG